MSPSRPPTLKDLADLGRAWKEVGQAEPTRGPPLAGGALIEKVAVASVAPDMPKPVTPGPGHTPVPAAVGEKNPTPTAVVISEIPIPLYLNQIEELRAKVEKQAHRIRELEGEVLAPGDVDLTPWERKLRAEEKKLAEERLAFEAELDELYKVRERETQVTCREQDANQLKTDLDERQAKLKDMERERGNLLGELAEADVRFQGVSKELTDVKVKIILVSGEARQFEADVAALTKKLKDARSELRAARTALDQFEQELAAANISLTKSNNALGRTKVDLARAVEKRDEALRLLSELPDLHIRREPILDWLVSESDGLGIDLSDGSRLGWTGEGPYENSIFDRLISDFGVDQYELPHESISHVVVGREGWSEEALIEQIEVRQGEPLRVYSQEMVVAAIITGRDPLDCEDMDVLNAFKDGHPALEFLVAQGFDWPTICVVDTSSVDGLGAESSGIEESPLHLLGYHVGKSSLLSREDRR